MRVALGLPLDWMGHTVFVLGLVLVVEGKDSPRTSNGGGRMRAIMLVLNLVLVVEVRAALGLAPLGAGRGRPL